MAALLFQYRGGWLRSIKNLLVVEDDKVYLLLLREKLLKMGFNVETAENAEESIQQMAMRPADIVITDLVLPNMDGLSLLKKIKADTPESEVIIISGQATIEKAVEAMKYGAFDFLVKPVSEKKLELLVERCVDFILTRGGMGGTHQKPVHEGVWNRMVEEEFANYSLTAQEVKIAKLVLEGKSDKEIGGEMAISYSTVKKHTASIYRKLGLKGRIELILKHK